MTNDEQYDVVAAMSTSPTMRLFVWRKDCYREVSAQVRHGWVWGRVGDYEPASTAGPRPAPAAYTPPARRPKHAVNCSGVSGPLGAPQAVWLLLGGR